VILALLLAVAAQGRLVVLVVVDQLRFADLTWLAPELGPRGFAGMGRPAQLRYETAVTETAADHAVLSTGAYADLNGIVGNRFWENGGVRQSVDDARCPVWGDAKAGKSASMLRVPTVGDAYKLNTDGLGGRVVTVSVKDRSALFLAGPSADLALWFELDTGEFASTDCYAAKKPAWVPEHPAAQYENWIWNLSRPDVIARLVPEERALGAVDKFGVGLAFPHKLVPGKEFFEAVRSSPASTTMALKAARAAVQAMQLGSQAGKTDLLGVALSAVDGVGHNFGSVSRERVDTVLRMHDELGAFLDELRRSFGPRLAIVLTADHGLTPMESDEKRLKLTQGGSENIDALIQKVNAALDEELGARREGWVAVLENSTVALRPPFPPKAVQVAVEVLRREPGFWRVVPFNEIAASEPVIRNAYFPGRSGQILVVPRPLWTLKKPTDGADHGSPWNDDAVVPLLVQAPGFRLRRDAQFRATQVAPTLAALLDTAPPAAALDSPAIEHE
jgi:hypothetical protein